MALHELAPEGGQRPAGQRAGSGVKVQHPGREPHTHCPASLRAWPTCQEAAGHTAGGTSLRPCTHRWSYGSVTRAGLSCCQHCLGMLAQPSAWQTYHQATASCPQRHRVLVSEQHCWPPAVPWSPALPPTPLEVRGFCPLFPRAVRPHPRDLTAAVHNWS